MINKPTFTPTFTWFAIALLCLLMTGALTSCGEPAYAMTGFWL